MANNGVYYSSTHTLNFTTTGTTWATLTSGGTFLMNAVSATTYYNLPPATFTGGTVTGPTIFTGGLTANTLNVTGNTTLANTSGTSFYTDYVDFNLTASTASSVGRLRYDSGEGGLVQTLLGGNVDLQIGQQNVVFCYNADTVTLTKGQVVAIFGNQGNRPKVQRAIASAETTSSTALGVVSETIISGAEGFITTFGNVRGFNLTGITPGSYVYLSPTTLGGFTGTQPQAPDHIVAIGYVIRTGTTQGEIFVNINNGWELNELHNVRITNPSQYDILQYSAGTSPVWYNTSSPFFSGLTATTISATTYQNLPYSGTVVGTGTTNYVPVWTNSTTLGDSIIQSNGSEIGVGAAPNPPYIAYFYTSGVSGILSSTGGAGGTAIEGQGGSGGIGLRGEAGGVGYGVYGIVAGGGGGGWGVYGESYNGIGVHGKSYGDTGPNIGVRGESDIDSGGTPENIGGYFSAINGGSNYSVQLTDGTEGIGKVLVSQTSDGKSNWSDSLTALTSVSATTYYNYPGSSSANCVSTFFVTNISGCSPVNILSPLNVVDGLSVTGTSTFTSQVNFEAGLSASTFSATTYQNLPVSAVTNGTGISTSTTNGVSTITNTDLGSSQNIFKNIQIDGVTQFSAGSNSSNLNFSGINITITSASTNTLVFSAATGGGGGGGVTSITAGTGLSGDTTTGAVTLQLSASSYSMFANNTASAAAPSEVTYKDTGDASFSSIVTWATTTPSPTAGDYRYRWTQIGNMVWFYFNWTSVSLGSGAISWSMPSDMPNPATPTGFNAANYVLHRYMCSFNNTAGGPTSGTVTLGGTTLLALRRNSSNTAWEWIIPATTSIRWFSATGHYFV